MTFVPGEKIRQAEEYIQRTIEKAKKHLEQAEKDILFVGNPSPNQISNKNLAARLAEMESRNPSLRTRAGIVRSYGYEPVMDKVGVDGTNQPAYKLRVLAPSYRGIDNDCDGVVDDYKPTVCGLGTQYSQEGQLLGHDGATADRPRFDDGYDNCDGCVDMGTYYDAREVVQRGTRITCSLRDNKPFVRTGEVLVGIMNNGVWVVAPDVTSDHEFNHFYGAYRQGHWLGMDVYALQTSALPDCKDRGRVDLPELEKILKEHPPKSEARF